MNIAAIVFAAALSAGNAEFDRNAAESAALVSLGRSKASLASEGVGAGFLERTMAADPAAFASRKVAEERCREIFVAEAERLFAEETSRVKGRLGLPAAFAVPFEAGDRARVAELFPKVFSSERAAAVQSQARTIVACTRPTEAEVETNDEATLAAEMAKKIAAGQKTPVFEENLAYISQNVVRPVLESAKAERKRQRDYMARARSDAATPSRMARELESHLRSNVAEHAKGAPAAEAWGIFPSVLSETLPATVKRRIVDRLASEAENTKLDVTEKAVLDEMAKDPSAHVKRRESERFFVAAYSAGLLAEALERHVTAVPEGDRAELKAFLVSNLQDAAVSKAVERTVRRDIMPKWSEMRKVLAEREASRIWPGLHDGTWFPGPELSDATVARSDYARAVKAWRQMAGMEELAGAAKGPVMEETDGSADARVLEAFERARSAIAAQNAILEGVHAEVLAEARRRKESFWSKTPDIGAIVSMLTEATESGWSGSRVATLWPDGNLPANAAEQHAALFPSVRRKIELLAKVILEEMNESSQQEDSSSGGEELLMEFSISVRKDGDSVEVKLLKGNEEVTGRNVKAKMTPFSAAMEEISNRLGRDLLKLK